VRERPLRVARVEPLRPRPCRPPARARSRGTGRARLPDRRAAAAGPSYQNSAMGPPHQQYGNWRRGAAGGEEAEEGRTATPRLRRGARAGGATRAAPAAAPPRCLRAQLCLETQLRRPPPAPTASLLLRRARYPPPPVFRPLLPPRPPPRAPLAAARAPWAPGAQSRRAGGAVCAEQPRNRTVQRRRNKPGPAKERQQEGRIRLMTNSRRSQSEKQQEGPVSDSGGSHFAQGRQQGGAQFGRKTGTRRGAQARCAGGCARAARRARGTPRGTAPPARGTRRVRLVRGEGRGVSD
jgi:hypothetical protein